MSTVEELEAKLAKALEALELADGIMSCSRGDAYERECTDKDYDAFLTIYNGFNPPPPPKPAFTHQTYNLAKPEARVKCPQCGKKVGEKIGMKAHAQAMHPSPTTKEST